MTAITEPFAPIGVGFTFHPKVSDLRRKGPVVFGRALALWLLGRLHAQREATGGVLPDVDLRMVYDAPDVRKLADALVEVGLWETHPRGYLIHDFDSSGGVVLSPEQAARPGATQEAAENKRRARNERYRKAHAETLRKTPRDGGKTLRKTVGETLQDAAETVGETVGKTPETAPSQTLPSQDQDPRMERGDAAPSHETPQDAPQDAAETPTEDASGKTGETPKAEIARLASAYPRGFAADLRHACALSRKGGEMADGSWLHALRRLAKHRPDVVTEAGKRFIEKHADGEKDENYLIGIVRGLERDRKSGLLPVSPQHEFIGGGAEGLFDEGQAACG